MNWNSRSGDLKVNRENGTHARFPAKMFLLFSPSFFFTFFSLTSGLMVFLWGSNCIHVISEALVGHGRGERDCYTVVEPKHSALLCSALLLRSHTMRKVNQ